MHSLFLSDGDIVVFRSKELQTCLVPTSKDTALAPRKGLAFESVPLTVSSEELARFCFTVVTISAETVQDGPWYAFESSQGGFLQSQGDILGISTRDSLPHPEDQTFQTFLFRPAVVLPCSEKLYVLEDKRGWTFKRAISRVQQSERLFLAPKEMVAGMDPELVLEISIISANPRTNDNTETQAPIQLTQGTTDTSVAKKQSSEWIFWTVLGSVSGAIFLCLLCYLMYWTARFEAPPKEWIDAAIHNTNSSSAATNRVAGEGQPLFRRTATEWNSFAVETDSGSFSLSSKNTPTS